MKIIRKNVFETNSSSCHSITFSSKGSGTLPSGDFILQVKGDDYGWEVETYSNAQDKFSYWFSAFRDCACIQFLNAAEENEKQGKSKEDAFDTTFEETYNKLAQVLLYLRDKGIHLYIFYDDWQHNLEDYLRDLQIKNTYKDNYANYFPGFNFLVETGYGIDHQSAPREDGDCRALGKSSPEEVFDWVFGDGKFETDNDNH